MITLVHERMCGVEDWKVGTDFRCPCLIRSSNNHYCALGYFNDQEPQTAWYNVDSEQLEARDQQTDSCCSAVLRAYWCIINQGNSKNIALSADEKETLLETLHRKWIEYLRFHPDDCWINPVMTEYPDDPPELWPVVYIPVCRLSDGEIQDVYTTLRCFTPEVDDSGDSPVFARKGILELLTALKVEGVVGTIDRWNFSLGEQEGLPLSSMAIKLDPNEGKIIEFIVGRFGGSLLMEYRDGWCIFRSE